MDLTFVNYRGDSVAVPDTSIPTARRIPTKARTPKAQQKAFHKGFVVEGVPLSALEEAEGKHAKKRRDAQAKGQDFPDFDRSTWLMNAKAKRICKRPFELEQAAREAVRLAEKQGSWLRVAVRADAQGDAPSGWTS